MKFICEIYIYINKLTEYFKNNCNPYHLKFILPEVHSRAPALAGAIKAFVLEMPQLACGVPDGLPQAWKRR
ncbi:hypothetical protein [Novosphingobium naphthalenivorans]|uniref:hypothetical protein n=1 Tax=Novosphingobium naphthalenivorans TaxID=273168 RepID=UPI0008376D3C|nr:hypothetical protein [Novosphingobium naphthalenivorans]